MTWDYLCAVSRRLNRLTGGDDEEVCCRVYYHAHTWGGFWIILMWAIDLAFLPWERQHVTKAYRRKRQ